MFRSLIDTEPNMDRNNNRITDCECPLSGYCERHKIVKTSHWWNLCQSRLDYFALWEANAGPGQHNPELQAKREAARQKQIEVSRELWTELHSKQDATPKWFASWLKKVPNYGCGCRSNFKIILKANPVRYDDWYPWSVEVHNAVNTSRGKPIWTQP